jgi:hypothetical protein
VFFDETFSIFLMLNFPFLSVSPVAIIFPDVG